MSEKMRMRAAFAVRHFPQIAIVFLPSEKFPSLDLLSKKCRRECGGDGGWCDVSVFIGKCVRVYDVVKMAFSCPLLVDCLDEMPKI